MWEVRVSNGTSFTSDFYADFDEGFDAYEKMKRIMALTLPAYAFIDFRGTEGVLILQTKYQRGLIVG